MNNTKANHNSSYCKNKIDFIRLARTKNIGPATFFRLLKIFPTIADIIEKAPEFLKINNSKVIQICSKNDVEKEIEMSMKYGAEIITFFDDEYPAPLKEIYDPALTLTIKGDKSLLHKEIIAVVGPRNASFHACQFAEKIANDLSQNDIVIASGLAKGIDAAAHKGSLDKGTVAVIAGGIDNIYPNENKYLYNKIFEKGLIITEQPFGAAPRGSNFIQRNRIISGISYGVVVVEAGMQSGSLATARFAIDQGREVFAVPGFPSDPKAFGCNMLIEDGAIFTRGADRVLVEINSTRKHLKNFNYDTDFNNENKKIDNISIDVLDINDVNYVRHEIQKKIGFVAVSIEEIISLTEMPASLVNIALVQLELADIISIKHGKVIKK